MKKILGLDLGTNSIGWAIVDEENNKILGMGSRIFPEGVVAKTIGTGDREESKNAARRNSRQLRRQYFRKRLRKIKLLRTLIDFNMCPLTHQELDRWALWDKTKGKAGRIAPNAEAYELWHRQNPYELRNKGLDEDLTLFELGRVLYHLIQRRGFLSNRKGKDDGTIQKGKPGTVGISKTKEQIGEKTLGSFLNSIYPKPNEPFKLITDEVGNVLRVRSRYTLRDMYVEEFNRIWKRQSSVHRLDLKKVESSQVFFLHGNLTNSRNKKRIENLERLYGKNNIQIEQIKKENSNSFIHKIKKVQSVSLEIFLGGQIKEDADGNIKFKSNDSVIFWQRPLRSQKNTLAKCRFEPDVKDKNGNYLQKGKTPCHLSHPFYEEFRAYQFINNIEFGKKQKLDEAQREVILKLINSKDTNINFSEIPKKLKLEYEKWNYENEQKVPGNYTTKHLSSLFTPEIWENHKEDIWHCFHFYEDADLLLTKLTKDYNVNTNDIEVINNINLKEGYSNVSLKAIRQILEFLRLGKNFYEAVILAGVKNAFGERWKYFEKFQPELEKNILRLANQKGTKDGEVIENIKNYLIENDFGFVKNDPSFIKLYHHSQEIEKKEIQTKLSTVENLRNPIVQQGINEMRRLVNQLVSEYGKFDRINVELGRNLKNGKQGRQELSNRIKKNTDKNDAARLILTEYGLAHSRTNVQKVLLYNEMQERGNSPVCPYTNKSLNIRDVLGGNNLVQIEHIIPKSTSLDDSFNNKTLCDAKFNSLKGNLTPYEFYKKNSNENLWGGAKSWEEIERRVARLLPYDKAKRFSSRIKTDDPAIQDNFIERQLNDTRYISKKTRELLSEICEDVRVLNGGLTSELRRMWGLNEILRPVSSLNLPSTELAENSKEEYFVVVDGNREVINMIPKNLKKPTLATNEITISGEVTKETFNTQSKYASLKFPATDVEDGKYWLILKLSEPKQSIRIFNEKPKHDEQSIIFKGKITNQKFSNETAGNHSAKGFDDGSYWAKFSVLNKKFEDATGKDQPKKNAQQVLLYGIVREGKFVSYIYECDTNLEDGKYWAILDLDKENVAYEKANNEKPEIGANRILLEGNVNDAGVFVSDMDPDFSFNNKDLPGKTWVEFEILTTEYTFAKQENKAPKINKGEELIQGEVWLDKSTGEIQFDPKKNRGDHRHHAIDALVIALSKLEYYRKISAQNAARSEKAKGNVYDSDQLSFPRPWPNFVNDAKSMAESILISFKQKKSILKKVSKKINKNGLTRLSVGNALKGQLHKENVYGERKAPYEKSTGYHIRKEVASLDNKQIEKIVDLEIKKIIQKARESEVSILKNIALLEKMLKKANESEETEIKNQIADLKKQKELLYTLKNKNGEPVPIRKVRVREEMSNAEKLKEANQFVNPRNNHHVLIYKDENGELKEDVVSFWKVAERLKQNLPIYMLPSADSNGEILVSLQENDMFIMGLSGQIDFDDNSKKNQLFNHLYRVQKISQKDYNFRLHLASTLDNDNEVIRIRSLANWLNHNPIKVLISTTGKIRPI